MRVTKKKKGSGFVKLLDNMLFVRIACVIFVIFSLGVIVKIVGISDELSNAFKYKDYSSAYFAVISDFISFYSAGKIVAMGKASYLYNLNFQYGVQMETLAPYSNSTFLLPFRNTPLVALLFLPFSLISFIRAYFLYVLCLAALYILFLKSTWNTLNKKYLFLLFVFFMPVYYSIVYATLSILVLAILFAVYTMFVREKLFLAGFLSGLLIIKPQFLLIVPFILVWLLRRDLHKFLTFSKGLLLSLVLLGGISTLLVGFSNIISYPLFLSISEREIFGSRWFQTATLNHTFTYLSHEWGIMVSSVKLSLFLYVLPLIYLARYSKKISLERLFAGAIPLVIVLSFHSLTHDLVLMLISILLLISESTKKSIPISRRLFLNMNSGFLFAFSLLFLYTQFFWIPLVFYFIGIGVLMMFPDAQAEVVE